MIDTSATLDIRVLNVGKCISLLQKFILTVCIIIYYLNAPENPQTACNVSLALNKGFQASQQGSLRVCQRAKLACTSVIGIAKLVV